MIIWIGVAIICISIYLLIKQYEARMVLIGAGLLMGALSGNFLAPLTAFQERMVNPGLMEPILSVAGFALVMRITKCDAHLIHMLAGVLKGGRLFLVPGTVIITFLINTSLPSAAGAAAAVGAIFIPLLISMGVNPAMAGSAVMMGTFGSLLSPGLMHNPFVAKLAGVPVLEVIANHYWPVIISGLIGAVCLGILAEIRKENRGYVTSDKDLNLSEPFKINPIFAVIPLLPLLMLILGSSSLGDTWPWLKTIRISHAMLLGALLGIAATRTDPAAGTREYFKGMGESYTLVMGIIIGAAVFVGGMSACGIIEAGNEALRNTTHLVRYAAAWGPFVLAVVTGSGDAASLAFNESVSPHAADFGQTILNLGSMSALAGALGRTMSPLTGACIICAGLAGVNPMEIAKRNAIGMVIACTVSMFLLV